MISCEIKYRVLVAGLSTTKVRVFFRFDDGHTKRHEIWVTGGSADGKSAEFCYRIMLGYKSACRDWIYKHRGTLDGVGRKMCDTLFRISSIEAL
jgi:hypothetical protein